MKHEKPCIFLSYSGKSADPGLIKKVVSLIKAHVMGLGWTVLDAMGPGLGSIRERVEETLWRADACVIEATTAVPNVMFEAGFARALG